MHEIIDNNNNNFEQLKENLATKNLVTEETENEDASNDNVQKKRHANITIKNEDSEFSFSTQMSSNLLDISATNDTSMSSDPTSNKNEALFYNINQLKDQVETKTIEILSTVTTII